MFQGFALNDERFLKVKNQIGLILNGSKLVS